MLCLVIERVTCSPVVKYWGYWRQRAGERFDDPSPKVDPGAFNGQRQGWKTPWQCTASVCVAGVHFWEIS